MSDEALVAVQPGFSRANPSQHYRRLIAQYRQLHVEGEKQLGTPPGETFSGKSLGPHAERIRRLLARTGSTSLLDYGCGKAILHKVGAIEDEAGKTYPSLLAYWGLKSVTLYDPAYLPYSTLPQGKCDAVICTDVLEHCPQEDIPWIVEELFGYANRLVFANIACYPAQKILPSGENAHCTIQPAGWWQELIAHICAQFTGVRYQFVITEKDRTGGELKKRETLVEHLL